MRIIFWIIGVIALIAIVGTIALQIAVSRNGPAVLSAVDRLTGGNGGAELKATISTGPSPAQKLIVWGPETRDPAAAPLPVIVFSHGGSWNNGDPDDYGFVGRAFVPEGFVVVLVGYRLVPDGVYPAMIEDTARAIHWTREEIDAYGGDPDRIIIAGHSAGAYNIMMNALEDQWLGRYAMSVTDIAGVVGISGPYDFVPLDSESTIAAFGNVDNPVITQPLEYVRADAAPMLLIHGEKDTLVVPRDSRILAEALTKAGGSVQTKFYPDMEHTDPLISLASPWRSRRDVVSVIAEFARSVPPAHSSKSGALNKTSVPVQDKTR